MSDLVMEELNVKVVNFDSNESKMLSLSAKPNFKKLGKELGKDMKKLQNALLTLSSQDIVDMQKGASKDVSFEDFSYTVTIDDIIIAREEKPGLKIMNEGAITVGLNTSLTPELIDEGYAREIVNKVQNLRKEKDFNVVDRITLNIKCEENLKTSLEKYLDYISSETLATEININKNSFNGVEVDINDKNAVIDVLKN